MENWTPSQKLVKRLGIEYPIICGAMYPCSNPELVAAVSEAGGLGIVQPLSLTFVGGYSFSDGIKKIRSLTSRPIGVNLLIEASSKQYLKRMESFLDQSLEFGIRIFVTALGNPRWVVDRVEKLGGFVFHDVTNLKWAQKARDGGVHGLICVNNRAGGHAGTESPEKLFQDLNVLGLPLVCAGGVGEPSQFLEALRMGYSAVQMGTRFIATHECSAKENYKAAILGASENDIVLSERITGVPVAIINTESVKREGTKASPLARWMLGHPKMKHWVRMFYSLKSFYHLKKAFHSSRADHFQAGKSVEGIEAVVGAGEIVRGWGAMWGQKVS